VGSPKARQNFLLKVRKELRRRRKGVKACYHEALKLRGKKLVGTLRFKFTLRANGSVKTVSGVRNSTGSAVLEKCVSRVLRTVKFPTPPAGVREFLYPISFKASR
jgi:TonB family protein